MHIEISGLTVHLVDIQNMEIMLSSLHLNLLPVIRSVDVKNYRCDE
jgi:hypothetical protein